MCDSETSTQWETTESEFGATFVVGTAGDDVLVADELGVEGPFIIFGLEGNDLICGSDGDDVIFGGLGNDVILGNGGNDVLHGDEGDDDLDGGDGIDRIDGGPGEDSITAGGLDARALDLSAASEPPQAQDTATPEVQSSPTPEVQPSPTPEVQPSPTPKCGLQRGRQTGRVAAAPLTGPGGDRSRRQLRRRLPLPPQIRRLCLLRRLRSRRRRVRRCRLLSRRVRRCRLLSRRVRRCRLLSRRVRRCRLLSRRRRRACRTPTPTATPTPEPPPPPSNPVLPQTYAENLRSFRARRLRLISAGRLFGTRASSSTSRSMRGTRSGIRRRLSSTSTISCITREASTARTRVVVPPGACSMRRVSSRILPMTTRSCSRASLAGRTFTCSSVIPMRMRSRRATRSSTRVARRVAAVS